MSEALRPAPSGPPTLEDVARVAGVSRATVSRVINGTRNVDPLIQQTVREAIAATGYVPNTAARSLVTRRTGAIALVVSGAGSPGPDGGVRSEVFVDPFFGRVVSGVVGFLRPLGMHPVLMLAETAEARDQVVAYLRQGNADGAMLVSTHAGDPLPGQLTEAGVPAVLFARPDRPIPISYVDVAHQDGAKLAADRLVERGCRDVATISGPLDVPASQDRLSGFREAMARHGFPYVPCVEGDFTQGSGEAAMERLLAEQPRIDGVFVANDLMAQGALLVLRDHGRRVPEDVAVIGFDDSSAATACRPALTTIRQPVEDMAAEMARMLLDRIQTPQQRVTSVIFEPSLVVRQSA
ncbi:LacI family DNA-binding transcriptional regulator [Streptomyces sp. H10-C2]|uniref:LacI family DNA-binding transcriptional regulator n=1 Tax=unclassified Streptomyces TaxID=2593676 RepID=UPI0024B92461|nr:MULTISPECIES: LacI family DNA-binding transcriptional regulator [unclassified Streptomyces]MDJ0342158.1 LacI family DNA-binding transcriptional regulator [Streptomyces sp. PH10-H1]MDJ0368672.1 LacI family DNA-binding transcriptional regulator [Streptomyces sp. H10-C2]